MTLKDPVIINDYVQPAYLPFDDDPDHVNEPVVLTGWGDYNASGSNSVLRKTTTTVISSSGSDEPCQQQAGLGPFSGDSIICSDGSQRYCSGDTGGPMNYYNKECDRWFVIGITGWIEDASANCQNSNKPNLFTRVRIRRRIERSYVRSNREQRKGNIMFITAILNGTDRFSCQWTTVAESAITTGPSPKTTIPTTHKTCTVAAPFECGRTKFTSSSRIAGGTEATPNEFPWMVHFILQNKTSGNQFTCGGTLITDRHVLSAGHCFYNADYTFGVRILNVTLGAHDMSTNSSDRFRQTIKWSAIKALSKFVRPACLPLRDDPDHVNDNVVLTGWDADSRSVLRKTITTVISSSGPNSTCQQQAGVGPFSGDKVICSEGYRLYCNDDDGEPMNFYNQECDRWFIIGVAGKGDTSASCQNSKRTDVFTRVRSHLDWIRRNTGVDSSPIECQSTGAKSKQTTPMINPTAAITEIPTTSARTSFECGRSKLTSTSRIVGGSEAKPNEFPWMVYILVQNIMTKKMFNCGGTLISDRHILTTSDCFFENQLFAVDILNITLGAHDLNANSSDSFRQIVKWNLISSYVRVNNSLSDYVSIVTLSKPVDLNDYVQPACLPFGDDPDHVGDPVILTGWGDYDNAAISRILRKTTTAVISSTGSNEQCQQEAGIGPFSGEKIICGDGSITTATHLQLFILDNAIW
ncbi:hypothetical protein DAPPUDRAFT_321261 [Daphnia pulex]|uniref:Peptidase S1 domain-containing protein n=1 Tax=Daphnia pulex TaxID=6669 RepID=E9GSD6_DAPPU|nr:hypothetical protein DAPPUDRAFT_321261 [Daphnia pulex]|eukprot:EFX77407.1 hypothetical protein DAPPUDRAFT_321261 [Daphnia pulex]